ncbi:phosphate-starvation-inducible PsiE family protein [Vagococcus carniphilus]|uniref:Protein PsiE n=1 Tax=Vagococcus carniphilus TaxID=218144 RepID=A0A430AMV6_9ENTE|nr:phosphate-starvation-inducible PsiE family protein [Vagococcus carniphilus]QNN71932.1 phosphate-starvation-inducible PsiE family protein [Vagococcus carniphilus]RSU09490.1 hypothetical protein CBF28_14850 [Vagococcus carniphilus]
MVEKYKNWLNRIIKLFLFALATLIIVYMARDLVEIFNVIIMPNSERSLGIISDYILAFFMLFEFIVMIVKYIEDTHNIPIKYLVIISITAILRQLLVIHNDAVQTIILTLAILILTIVLYVIELIKKKEIERKKNK